MEAMGHVALVAITGTNILVSYLQVKPLQLIWRSGSGVPLPDIQMICSDLTIWPLDYMTQGVPE